MLRLGVDDLDVDVPSNWEVGFFTNMAMKVPIMSLPRYPTTIVTCEVALTIRVNALVPAICPPAALDHPAARLLRAAPHVCAPQEVVLMDGEAFGAQSSCALADPTSCLHIA